MRLPALNGLKQFGKVFTPRTNREAGPVTLLVSYSAAASSHQIPWLRENWRLNAQGVVVGGAKLEGILDTAEQIGEKTGYIIALPDYDDCRERLLGQRRLFEANGIGTFYAWEEDDCSRINIFELEKGKFLYEPHESLEIMQTNWNRHGLVFIARQPEPRSRHLALTLRLG